jgi:O-antigen ligase
MFGANLFGLNVSNYTSYYRVSGIFGDELILGAFLTYLGIPVLGYYYSNFSNLNNKKKILLIIVSFILWFVIFISGERINFLVFSLFIALLLFYFLNIKRTIIVITIGILIFSGFVSYHEKLNEKYSHFKNIIVNFEDSSYGYIYTRTLSVWLDRPIFGTGLKNYRYNCDKKYPYDEKVHKHPTCQTHPHNFILEMLTETGVIGTILFSIFFISALNINVFHIKKFYNRKFLTMYSSLFVLMIYFFPIKSSGSFFSTFNASLFWFNFSIFIFYVNKYFIKNK